MNTVITSFTEKGFNQYGSKFLESFALHWPKDVNLVVYYEGDNIRPGWHYIDEVDGYQEWMNAISSFPMMRGDLGDGSYEIQLDAGMARKSFMQVHAARQYGGKVFWIDADVFTHSDVPRGFLDSVLPDDKFCCFLGREGWTFPDYTESGFLGFNANHPMAESFFGAYLAVFKSGLIFRLNGWHDCYGFDAARRGFKGPGIEDAFVNLSKHLKVDSTNHPFVNSILGKYMDHRKGNRKSSRTASEELVVKRHEPYWTSRENEPTSTDAPKIILTGKSGW